MIEVFRTNITRQKDANRIINKIHSAFPGYEANFDLHDCDHILRIRSRETLICHLTITSLIENFGFTSEILPDNIPETHFKSVNEKSLRL